MRFDSSLRSVLLKTSVRFVKPKMGHELECVTAGGSGRESLLWNIQNYIFVDWFSLAHLVIGLICTYCYDLCYFDLAKRPSINLISMHMYVSGYLTLTLLNTRTVLLRPFRSLLYKC